MSTCPRTDRLLRLLGDDLPESEQTELVAHLDTCPDCRGALDGLAARSGLWHELSLLRDDPLAPPTADWSKGPEPQPQDDEDIPLGVLEPSDNPGYLGKLGPYDVLRLIGRGGMGIVFLARDRALDRLVAIKLLTPGMAATGAARRRFAREAKAAAAVVHEHVVTIHAVDTLPQGVPYLVMQYIAGKSVQNLIDRGKAPELAEILRIGSQAASALAAAHAQGLIHRDIKPANILLENGVERVKITDFGLARAVDDATMTQSGVVAGTPQYMSPEQAGGERIDHRTDLFSLGSVLYALCTGQAPFRGGSSMATLKRVCEQTPTPIQALNPAIPSWMVKIIDRLHAKDPADRYDSAADVADLLRRCLAHVQQPASVPLPAELVPARNRRVVALWGAIPVCLLLAGLLCFPWARAAAGQAVSYVATVLRLKTPEGTLVVETDDPNVGIKLDGSDLVVTGAGVKELRLSVGKHNVQALKDGKVLRDELVTISRGGRTVLSVRREAEDPQPPLTPLGPVPGAERNRSAQEFNRLANALKNNPLLSRTPSEAGTRLYLRDLVEGRTTMIADPAVLGLRFVGCPSWSHDGRRIMFELQPRISDWSESRVVIIESHEGRANFRDLGAGCCPSFSPDDQTIAFNLPPGEVPGEQEGVWLMSVDGTNRRRVCESGAPFWSPDESRLLINGAGEPTKTRIYTFATNRSTRVEVPGRKFWSWPRWTGPSQLVASIGGETAPDSIVLVDISRPSEAKVVRTLWSRSSGPNVNALWPWVSPSSEEGFFIGNRGKTRTLYSFTPDGGGRVRLSALESGGPKLTGLTLSGDGRYLLFASDWLDREARGDAPATVSTAAAQEALRLAEALRESPARPSKGSGTRMQIYLRDLVEDRTTLVADEPILGHVWCGDPDWSHDGTKILFDASADDTDNPGQRTRSRLMVLERRDGQPRMRDLGPGLCGKFSPDDRRIVFALNPEDARDQAGIWDMKADGTDRSRLNTDAYGAPSWSDDRRQLLINTFNDPARSYVYDFPTRKTTQVDVPGLKIFSWPRWAGPHTLVASLGARNEPEAIDLLDILRPERARVERRLWRRSDGPDIYARWPLYESSTGACYFLGARGETRAILKASGGPGKPGAVAIEGGERPDRMGGLSVSPGGRFLVFNADRPDRAAGSHPR
jgi:Tol biopolymer transport system component